MKLFIIHRFKEKKNAKSFFNNISKNHSMKIQPLFLDSSGSNTWKEKAINLIYEAEAVVVFNPQSCEDSENANWEIDKAQEANKEIIEFSEGGANDNSISKLISRYEMKEEFELCFSDDTQDYLELYKVMIESSENLIERRQKTNAFFITVIGSLLAIAGLLVKTGAITIHSISILYGFSTVGLLLCNSWRNLIDNYGKLNKSKFDVLLRLEKKLGALIFSAEWISLGKGIRPQKYKSFTSTEKNVPLFFGLLIVVLTIIAIVWQIWG